MAQELLPPVQEQDIAPQRHPRTSDPRATTSRFQLVIEPGFLAIGEGGPYLDSGRPPPRHSWSLDLEDLEALRAAGKIGADGASNFSLHEGHTHR